MIIILVEKSPIIYIALNLNRLLNLFHCVHL